MVEENISYNPEELFIDIAEQARSQGVTTQEAWDELVDAELDARLGVGEMDKDDDLVNLREVLQARFVDFAAEL